MGALRICEEDNNFIFDETWRRDQLEDPEYDTYTLDNEEEEEEEAQDEQNDLDKEQDLDLEEE